MKEEIKELIRATLYLKPDQVTDGTLLKEIARDSMDIVELVAVLTETYKIAFEPKKMNNVHTVGDIVEYVIQNKGSGSGRPSIETF